MLKEKKAHSAEETPKKEKGEKNIKVLLNKKDRKKRRP